MSRIPVRLLRQRVTINRMSRTHDGQGGHIESFALLKGNVPCRIIPISPSEQTIGDREEVKFTHKIHFLPEEDIRRGDQVIGLAGQTTTTHTYEVMVISEPSKQHHIEVLTKEFILGS